MNRRMKIREGIKNISSQSFASGYGGGQTYLGFLSAPTTSEGNADLSLSFPAFGGPFIKAATADASKLVNE